MKTFIFIIFISLITYTIKAHKRKQIEEENDNFKIRILKSTNTIHKNDEKFSIIDQPEFSSIVDPSNSIISSEVRLDEKEIDKLDRWDKLNLFGIDIPYEEDLNNLDEDVLDEILENGLEIASEDTNLLDFDTRIYSQDEDSESSIENEPRPKIEKIIESLNEESTINEKESSNHSKTQDENSIKLFYNSNKINFTDLSEYIDLFRQDVRQYIMYHITKNYRDIYLRRLEGITRGINILKKYKEDSNTRNFVLYPFDIELITALRQMLVIFGKDKLFNQRTCHEFIKNLKLHSHEFIESYRQHWYRLSYDERIFLFYYEFNNLYKYVYYIPELLTLGGLILNNVFNDFIYIIHLINVFIENVGNLKKDQVFIKCLIYRAFLSSPKFKMKLFLVQKFQRHKGQYRDLQFFTWEMNRLTRQKLKHKVKKKNTYNKSDQIDITFMKSGLLLFLYQYMIFFRFQYVTIEDLYTFSNFIKRIKTTDECFICIFDDFLEMIRKTNKSI